MRRHLEKGQIRPVAVQLENLLRKVDGCVERGTADRNDWLATCSQQTVVYWALHELDVLLAIE